MCHSITDISIFKFLNIECLNIEFLNITIFTINIILIAFILYFSYCFDIFTVTSCICLFCHIDWIIIESVYNLSQTLYIFTICHYLYGYMTYIGRVPMTYILAECHSDSNTGIM